MDRRSHKPGRELNWLAQVDIMSQHQEDLLRPSRKDSQAAERHASKQNAIIDDGLDTLVHDMQRLGSQDQSVSPHLHSHNIPEKTRHDVHRSQSNASNQSRLSHSNVSSSGMDQNHTPQAAATTASEHCSAISDQSMGGGLQDSMAKSIVMSQQLEMLTERMPISGQAVSVIIRLMDLCVAARPVAQNARELARLCLDVIDIIEDLVEYSDILTPDLFKALYKAFQTAVAQVELFSRPGWLMHLTFFQDVKGQFESTHQLIVETLEGCVPAEYLGEVLAHKRRYTDPSRPLLRVLRQIGHGDHVEGIYEAQNDPVHVHSIVHALTPVGVSGVDHVAVRRELKGLPPREKDVDVQRMYRTGAAGSISEVQEVHGPDAIAGLRKVYRTFATYGQRYNGAIGLDGQRFMKLAQDSGLVGRGRKLKNADVDLVFAKFRPKGERVLSFEQFVEALEGLSKRSSCSLSNIVTKVLECRGPITRGTTADNVRFYDDKSTYTGTWAHGGGPPTNYDGAKDLGRQLSRDIKADRRRGQRITGDFQLRGSSGGVVSPLNNTPKKSPMSKVKNKDTIFSKFISFAIFGKGAAMAEAAAANPHDVLMDSKGFAKLCKESRIMSANLDLTRVDLIFTKFCCKTTKRMTYSQFLCALEGCAEARGITLDDLKNEITASDGPVLHGTTADAVRFHDDRPRRSRLSTPPHVSPLINDDGRPVWDG